MQVSINMDRLNEKAFFKIAETLKVKWHRDGKRGNLMQVLLPSGSLLVAWPISSINPLAPPELFIKNKSMYSEDNRKGVRRIVNVLRPACKSKHLPEAVRLLKTAINSLSKQDH